ncbi:hypothetical protein HYDPIDRAFT_105410 [Hydnomerulius pinastri MD-312]|nr:hypothetical protein HYDPIDRAFT_105410 [Hydnomerulius pinastri MD-312]
MPITEFAILPLSNPDNLSNPTVIALFQKLSAWQSECSSFSLLFFTNLDNASEVHLISGWESVEAHLEWIKGDRNQELLRVFAPYIDIPKVRMVHLDIDFDSIPKDVGTLVVERYGEGYEGRFGGASKTNKLFSVEGWAKVGMDMSENGHEVYRIANSIMEQGSEVEDGSPKESWRLRAKEF